MQLRTAFSNPLNSRQGLGNLLLSLLFLFLVGKASSQTTDSSKPSSSTSSSASSSASSSMATFVPKPGVSIVAYDVNDRQQFTLTAADLPTFTAEIFPLIDSVTYYLIGNGPTRLEVRSPFGGGSKAQTMAAALEIVNDFVFNNRDTDNVTVKLDASDWSHITSNICQTQPPTPSSPCPDVIFLGTTEIAGLAANDTIISLETYFSQYTQANSWLLKDSFSKFTYYDYTFDGDWVAVPLTADIRLLFYNQTTFRTLNLTEPPPNQDWGAEWWTNWTWTQFVQYATTISNSGLGYGFTFSGNFDEETKLVSMIARNWNVQVVTNNGTCGLKNPNFNVVLDQVIRPLFKPNNTGLTGLTPANAANFFDPTAVGFQEWLQTPLESVNLTTLDPNIFCCQYNGTPEPIVGMNIDSPQSKPYATLWALEAANSANNINSTNATAYVGDLGVGFAPGIATFLGGTGVAITKGSQLKPLAWRLIVQMTSQDPSASYLNVMNIANGLFPPYDTSLDLPPWNAPAYDTARQAFKHAVPIQYPIPAVPQMSNIEDSHVFRQMMLEIVLKNATNDQAIGHACEVNYLFPVLSAGGSMNCVTDNNCASSQILEDILAPECTSLDWNFTQPMYCTPGTNNLDLVYSWNQPQLCRRGYTLPNPYSVNCPYVAINSPFGIAITALTGFGCFTTIVYMIMLAMYRRSDPVKMASFAFCEFILIGSLFMYMTPLFMTGTFATWRCNLSIWVLVIGFGMTFGGLFVKLLRIYRIFSNRGLQVLRVSDGFLFRNLIIILSLEIITLLVWTFVGGGPQIVSNYLATEPTLKISIYQNSCNYGSSGALAGVGVLNLILIIFAIGIGFATWSVPTQFNETKVIITSVFGVAFGCIVCVPLLYFVQSASLVMIVSLTIDFVLVISMAIFCVPKLYEAIRLENLRASRSRSSTRPGWFIWESSAPKMGLSKPKGGITIEYTKSKVISSSTKGNPSGDGEMERQLGDVSETSEDSAIRMEPTAMSPAARRNALNSHDGANNPVSSRKQFNFDRPNRQTKAFCPHCGLGIDECEPH